jgi:hypothetical protein
VSLTRTATPPRIVYAASATPKPEAPYNYHAVPTNSNALSAFRLSVLMIWHRTLWRRSQKDRTLLETTQRYAERWLPAPRILHPWPNQRFTRQAPEVGAECANRACSDLTGGRAVMPVPTGLGNFSRS